MTSVCIFIGCWPWSIKGHTQMAQNRDQPVTNYILCRWRQIHVRTHQQTCFSFFMPRKSGAAVHKLRKSFNKPFEFLLYETNRLHFPCVCTVIDHRRSLVLYTLWHHLWSITVHTHGKMFPKLCYIAWYISNVKIL